MRQNLHQIALGLLLVEQAEKDGVGWTRKAANTLCVPGGSPVSHRPLDRCGLGKSGVFRESITEVFRCFHYAVRRVNGFEFESWVPSHTPLPRSPPELPSFSFRAAASVWTAGGNTMS